MGFQPYVLTLELTYYTAPVEPRQPSTPGEVVADFRSAIDPSTGEVHITDLRSPYFTVQAGPAYYHADTERLYSAQGGTLEIIEVAAPGLLADLPSNLHRVAPLYRFRTNGLRGQYAALLPLGLLQDGADGGAVCSATLSDGQWTIAPVERRDSDELAVEVSVDRVLGNRTGAPQDRYVTLIVPEASDGRAEGCP